MTQTLSTKASLSHEERTATEPRDEGIHPVIIDCVSPVNDRIRRFRLSIKDRKPIHFLPGQWLDVHVPGIDKAGGFTITSSPRQAVSSLTNDYVPYLELAVQESPDNPPAAWLWKPAEEITGKEVHVRVGGSFVWPPQGVDMSQIKRAIFIAGGVGINPLISMLSFIHEQKSPIETRILYSTKAPSKATQPSEILFLPDLLDLFRKPRSHPSKDRIELFFTGTWHGPTLNRKDDEPLQPLMSQTLPFLFADTEVPVVAWTHRIDDIALSNAVGNRDEASSSVFYVCGPPKMTDSIVGHLKKQEHIQPERVLCEKWW
ncbi:hypothetical protein K458DRAFT_285792 [Lentithecium fluviatile CBS 122367]|uniref:FAD-binding FR-type domain-containing protein n=1 Tax=Lentithecium fluviatile CBS 122367 TaxID=1168545 RepID=A0A6G1JLF8_9PLEO|nr:hypothetical protein K458DRAFT_285792 [Lentithecium fluviatile CBS 122367]